LKKIARANTVKTWSSCPLNLCDQREEAFGGRFSSRPGGLDTKNAAELALEKKQLFDLATHGGRSLKVVRGTSQTKGMLRLGKSGRGRQRVCERGDEKGSSPSL